MSGFAAITGEPDGPPTLPPFGLADGIAALATAFAVMAALRRARPHRPRAGGRPGDHRADPDDARRAADGLRPARLRAAAHRQPLGQQRAAQRLPHRATATGSRSRPARRASPSGCCGWSAGQDLVDAAVVRHRAASGPSTPTSSTPRSAAGSRRAGPRRGAGRRSTRPRPRSVAVYDVRGVLADPQYQRPRHRADRRRPGPRAAGHAERAVPALRDAGRGALGRPRATAPTPTRCSRELGLSRRGDRRAAGGGGGMSARARSTSRARGPTGSTRPRPPAPR